MQLINVKVYYNEIKGFIISAQTEEKRTGFNTVINPVEVMDKDVSDEEIGRRIRENLERSKNAMPVERKKGDDYHFWNIMGIKSFSAFSKKFSCVDITENAVAYEIMKLHRETSGAYLYPEKNDVELSLGISDYELGSKVRALLNIKADKVISTNEFDSVFSENKVRYQIPSDKFLDIGDGHTDAYQVYVHENDEDTFFGFMIDSGYHNISKESIRERWEELYGKLENFEFKRRDDCPIKISVSATAKTAFISSYFWRDGEHFLELFVQINIKNKTRQRQAEKTVKAVMESVEIIRTNEKNV